MIGTWKGSSFWRGSEKRNIEKESHQKATWKGTSCRIPFEGSPKKGMKKGMHSLGTLHYVIDCCICERDIVEFLFIISSFAWKVTLIVIPRLNLSLSSHHSAGWCRSTSNALPINSLPCGSKVPLQAVSAFAYRHPCGVQQQRDRGLQHN